MNAVRGHDDVPPGRHHGLPGMSMPSATVRAGYTRFVAVMRRLLPVAVIGLVTLLFAWPQIRALEQRVQVGYSNEELTSLGRNAVTLVNARYYGLDKEMKPYSVLAEVARQNEDEIVTLDEPRADMLTKEGDGVLIDAVTGTYSKQDQILVLQGDVAVYHDRGYELHTQSAELDLAAGAAQGHEPVTAHGPQIEMQGEGFRMLDRGRTIFLTGKSNVVLYPKTEGGR